MNSAMHPSRQSSKVERVLVCILSAKTRAHELCFSSFKRHVLDELNADLAVALTISTTITITRIPSGNMRNTAGRHPNLTTLDKALISRSDGFARSGTFPPQDWRALLAVKGIWQGRIQSPEPQPTASSIQTFCRWLLLHGLRQDGVLDRYDRFVLTRSDFFWLSSHPPLDVLDPDMIWVPEGQDYGGLNDRHLVASRQNIGNCLEYAGRNSVASVGALSRDEAQAVEQRAVLRSPSEALRP